MGVGCKQGILKNNFPSPEPVVIPMKAVYVLFLLFSFIITADADNPDYKRAIELKEKGQWNEALEIFKSLLAADSNNVSYLQQTSFLLLKTGFVSGNEALKKKNYRTAEYLTLKAIRLDSADIQSRFFYLAALGRLTEISTNMEKLQMVKKIRSECDFILSRDSANGATWHVLGRWHREIAALSSLERWMMQQMIGKVKGGTFDDALFCFYKAIRYAPYDISHYYETAVTLSMRKKPGDREAAISWLTKGLAIPSKEFNADEKHFREMSQKLLTETDR